MEREKSRSKKVISFRLFHKGRPTSFRLRPARRGPAWRQSQLLGRRGFQTFVGGIEVKESVFRDRLGHYVAYSEDEQHVYLFSGAPAARIAPNRALHSPDGAHLGWFVDGWIVDENGSCIFWTWPHSDAGPKVLPVQSLPPPKAQRLPWPASKPDQKVEGNAPAIANQWSKESKSAVARFFRIS